MLNDNAKKWVAALRSGEYEQGKLHLCKDGKFCCLGVACDLFVKSGGKLNVNAPANEPVEYNGSVSLLPCEVKDWLGLTTSMGHSETASLAYKNDMCGCTFAEIADLIESEPEGLFVQEVTH